MLLLYFFSLASSAQSRILLRLVPYFPPSGDACGVLVTRFGICRLCAARYGARAWTRLEAMSMYAVSVLKQVSTELCADAWAVHPGPGMQ